MSKVYNITLEGLVCEAPYFESGYFNIPFDVENVVLEPSLEELKDEEEKDLF